MVWEFDIELTLLHLGLLQAEEISIERLKHFLEVFAHYGTQAVYIPTDEFHTFIAFLGAKITIIYPISKYLAEKRQKIPNWFGYNSIF